MNRTRFTLIASLLVLALFLLGHGLVQKTLAGARVDLTERGLFTLDEATKDTVATLAEPVSLTLVYSRRVGADYPAIRTHAARVREILRTYASLSGGRVRVTEIDAQPFSEAEDEAVAAGITAVPTEGPDPLYFGVIGRNLADDEAVIPFLAPEQDTALEYELTRLIAGLDRPEPPRIGVITTLPGLAGDGLGSGYAVLQSLAEGYRIVPVAPDFIALPERLDALLIAHPRPFTRRQSYVVEQFLLRQGKAVILLDPASRASQTPLSLFDPEAAETRSDLPLLLSGLGLTLEDTLAGDRKLALPVRVETGDGRSAVVNQPLFIGVPGVGMSDTHPATADLARAVNLGTAGHFALAAPAGLTLEPLITTTTDGAVLPVSLALENAPPDDVLAAFQPGGRPLVLAVSVTGTLATAFPDGPVLPELSGDPVLDGIARELRARPLPLVTASETPLDLVVIADTDLLDDGFYLDPSSGVALADNGALIENAFEAMIGTRDLSDLRARAPALRPMTRVEALRNEAQTRYFGEQAALETQLQEAETRLAELRARGGGSDFLEGTGLSDLTPTEQAELDRLTGDILRARERLRAIERDFRRDIDRLEGGLKVLNIWLMPGLVLLFGLGLSLALKWRRG